MKSKYKNQIISNGPPFPLPIFNERKESGVKDEAAETKETKTTAKTTQSPIVKSAQSKNIEKNKQEYFTIKLEVMIPATLTYQVLADSPEKAVEKILASPTSIPFREQPKLIYSRLRKIKISVYNLGTTLIRFIKNF